MTQREKLIDLLWRRSWAQKGVELIAGSEMSKFERRHFENEADFFVTEVLGLIREPTEGMLKSAVGDKAHHALLAKAFWVAQMDQAIRELSGEKTE